VAEEDADPADHTAEVIGKLEKKPAVMGHSTGGLFAQMLAGRGLSAATAAIDPGVFRGVLPLPSPRSRRLDLFC
jgi:non-heme chloroperoxidase